MTNKLTTSLALGMATFAFPLIASAATPQQILDSVNSMRNRQPAAIAGTVDVSLQERAIIRGTALGSGSGHFTITHRMVPTATSTYDLEGRFSLDKGSIKDAASGESLTLDEPLTLQWKYISGTPYLRLEQLPSTLRSMLAGEQVNVDAIVGTWLSFDKQALSELSSEANVMDQTNPHALLDQLKKMGVTHPLLAQRIESRKNDAQGHSIVRIRARINPAIMRAWLQTELKQLDRKSSYYKQDLAEVYANYNKAVSVVNKLSFVFMIDETSKNLQRVEVGGTFTQPRKTCTWNAAYTRQTCRTVAMQTVKVLAGFSINSDSGAAVETPSSSMTLEQLMELLNPPSPSMNMPLNPDTTSGSDMTQTLTSATTPTYY